MSGTSASASSSSSSSSSSPSPSSLASSSSSSSSSSAAATTTTTAAEITTTAVATNSTAPSTTSSSSSHSSIQAALNALSEQPKETRSKADLRKFNAVLIEIAETGSTSFDWPTVRVLLEAKLRAVISEYQVDSPPVEELDGESFEHRMERTCSHLVQFPRAPFTLQRMAELLFEPKKYNSTTARFFLAFAKLVSGISARDFDKEAAEESLLDGKDRTGELPTLAGIESFDAFQDRMNMLPIETHAIKAAASSSAAPTSTASASASSTAMDTTEE